MKRLLTASLFVLALTFALLQGCGEPDRPDVEILTLPVAQVEQQVAQWKTDPTHTVNLTFGTSMEPWIRTGDQTLAEPPSVANLVRRRVAVFNVGGRLILHEIYDVKGDAVYFVAYQGGRQVRDGWGWIDRKNVVGVVVRVLRTEKAQENGSK